jgi:hypothetical protein
MLEGVSVGSGVDVTVDVAVADGDATVCVGAMVDVGVDVAGIDVGEGAGVEVFVGDGFTDEPLSGPPFTVTALV